MSGSEPNVIAIIQARMASTRLPGKVLLDLAGEPMLARVVSRTQRASTLNGIVVATTSEPRDEPIVLLCRQRGWPCFRGSEEDVLDRTYLAAMAHEATVVIRVTSDCPLIEPTLIDRVVAEFLDRQPQVDYASNNLPRPTFPAGLDVEVMRRDALECAWREDTNPAWREHVSEYLRRHPERFGLHGVTSETDRSSLRWTVDEPADLELVRRIYEHFGHDAFNWLAVLALLDEHPAWVALNRHVRQKQVS